MMSEICDYDCALSRNISLYRCPSYIFYPFVSRRSLGISCRQKSHMLVTENGTYSLIAASRIWSFWGWSAWATHSWVLLILNQINKDVWSSAAWFLNCCLPWSAGKGISGGCVAAGKFDSLLSSLTPRIRFFSSSFWIVNVPGVDAVDAVAWSAKPTPDFG